MSLRDDARAAAEAAQQVAAEAVATTAAAEREAEEARNQEWQDIANSLAAVAPQIAASWFDRMVVGPSTVAISVYGSWPAHDVYHRPYWGGNGGYTEHCPAETRLTWTLEGESFIGQVYHAEEPYMTVVVYVTDDSRGAKVYDPANNLVEFDAAMQHKDAIKEAAQRRQDGIQADIARVLALAPSLLAAWGSLVRIDVSAALVKVDEYVEARTTYRHRDDGCYGRSATVDEVLVPAETHVSWKAAGEIFQGKIVLAGCPRLVDVVVSVGPRGISLDSYAPANTADGLAASMVQKAVNLKQARRDRR